MAWIDTIRELWPVITALARAITIAAIPPRSTVRCKMRSTVRCYAYFRTMVAFSTCFVSMAHITLWS